MSSDSRRTQDRWPRPVVEHDNDPLLDDRATRAILEREGRILELAAKLEAADRAMATAQERGHRQQEQIDLLRADLRQQRAAVLAAIRETEKLRRSFHYRFGKLLIDGFTSLSGLAHFPGGLWSLLRDIPKRKQGRGRGAGVDGHAAEMDTRQLLELLHNKGLEGARKAIPELAQGDVRARAALLSELSRLSEGLEAAAAIELAREAASLDPRPFRVKHLAFLLASHGAITEPVALLDSLPADIIARFKSSERIRREKLAGQARLLTMQSLVPAKAVHIPFAPLPGRILFVVASALPQHLTGYTRRTHALVAAARGIGLDVVLATRPGYPADRPDVLPAALAERIDLKGITAITLDGPSFNHTPMDRWVIAAAARIETEAMLHRPAVIHAPSNWQNALPALIAARRLGLPFVYGARGFWEMTRASRQPLWARSQEHRLNAELENLVAGAAEIVVTHSQRLADMLVKRGVTRERIAIVANGSDAQATPPDIAGEMRIQLGLDRAGFWVGYVGSVVDYEGVDDLVRAIAHLSEDNIDARAVIAGEGNGLEAARNLAAELGISERVAFLGTVTPDVGEKVLAASDALALPRHSFAVTDLVEPLKPAEAMASGRPLVASDVLPHRDVVADGKTGLLYPAGDARALAARLKQLAADPGLAAALADEAAAYVEQHRRWADIVVNLATAWENARQTPPENAGALQLAAEAAPAPAPGNGLVSIAAGSRSFSDDERKGFVQLAELAFRLGGVAQLRDLALRQSEGQPRVFRARCLVLAAAAARRGHDLTGEMALLKEAEEISPSAATWRPLARAYWSRGHLAAAQTLVERLEQAEAKNPLAETAQLKHRITQRATLMDAGQEFLARHGAKGRPVQGHRPNSAAYFLHFTLPYASNGYATRSHGLLKGLRTAKMEVTAFSRPGFPLDIAGFKGGDPAEQDVIDGITYHRLLQGNRADDPELDYILGSADAYEESIRWLRPAVVHAASNYTTGLPALLAARRTGRPFIYEVRGFWEITRATRHADFERNPQFEMIRNLENLVAREADRVITLTSGMRDQLIENGVAPERISVVPNSVDPQVFRDLPRDEGLAERLGIPPSVPVIGYVGSIVGYEGLDDLISACALLRDAAKDFRILLVGDGAARQAVLDLARKAELNDYLIAPGRVPNTQVTAYYSLIDICPFPRKPIALCEMVSPLKPFEAMAMHKAVVASDVRALGEIVTDRVTGLLFRKGDVKDLARALGELIDQPGLRRELGDQARQWIEQQRSWDVSGEAIAALYRELEAAAARA